MSQAKTAVANGSDQFAITAQTLYTNSNRIILIADETDSVAKALRQYHQPHGLRQPRHYR